MAVGATSGVNGETKDVILELHFFAPLAIAGPCKTIWLYILMHRTVLNVVDFE